MAASLELLTDTDQVRRRWLNPIHRADCFKRQHLAVFGYFAPEAREILDDLLEKYADDGELQLVAVPKHPPDVPRRYGVPPISHHGNVAEIAQHFGGLENLGDAVNQLQALLYAA
jgi:type I restriction enzyme R subunit